VRWTKLGLVFAPDGSQHWAKHTALQPTPVLIRDDVIRVFVGMRDATGVSRVGWVDVRADDPQKVIGVGKEPCLDIGEPGMFDENGVVPCAVVKRGEQLWMYYAGYMLPKTVRFIAFSGLSISDDGGTSFKRIQRTPILERSEEAPLFRAIHFLLYDTGRWRVWYGAGDSFVPGNGKTLPVYNIRYMESPDGLAFSSSGRAALDLQGTEHRLGRPNIIRTPDGSFRMFFGYGSSAAPYRLGLAKSPDGLSWERCDSDLGLDLSADGWDSQMMAYPYAVTTTAGTFLFYNGNDYGREGFGIAVLEQW